MIDVVNLFFDLMLFICLWCVTGMWAWCPTPGAAPPTPPYNDDEDEDEEDNDEEDLHLEMEEPDTNSKKVGVSLVRYSLHLSVWDEWPFMWLRPCGSGKLLVRWSPNTFDYLLVQCPWVSGVVEENSFVFMDRSTPPRHFPPRSLIFFFYYLPHGLILVLCFIDFSVKISGLNTSKY